MTDAPALGVINTSVCGNGLGILSINRQKALNAMNLGVPAICSVLNVC